MNATADLCTNQWHSLTWTLKGTSSAVWRTDCLQIIFIDRGRKHRGRERTLKRTPGLEAGWHCLPELHCMWQSGLSEYAPLVATRLG